MPGTNEETKIRQAGAALQDALDEISYLKATIKELKEDIRFADMATEVAIEDLDYLASQYGDLEDDYEEATSWRRLAAWEQVISLHIPEVFREVHPVHQQEIPKLKCPTCQVYAPCSTQEKLDELRIFE